MFVNHEQSYTELSTDTDEDKINLEFVEKPDNEVVLLATSLARPDGFIKSLICGSLMTSEELVEKVGRTFVRTHRGFYKSFPPSLGKMTNNDLSFRLGLGQKMYTQTMDNPHRPWLKGLGYVIPAEEMINQPNFSVEYIHFRLDKLVGKIKTKDRPTAIEQKIVSADYDDLKDYDLRPPKFDLLEVANLARRENLMNENKDQGEIKLLPFDDNLPRLDLQRTIILVPASSKEAFLRLVQIKLHECQTFAAQILQTFGVDVTKLMPDDVLAKYPNIYWYPQKNIGLAIKYLTTHPSLVKRILTKNPGKPGLETTN